MILWVTIRYASKRRHQTPVIHKQQIKIVLRAILSFQKRKTDF